MTRRTSRRTAIVGAAGLVLGASFGPPLAAAGTETIKDVLVRNTEAAPVPTRVVGTPRVQVDGTPRVQVEGTPTVHVGAPVEVRGAVTPVRGQPVQATGRVVVGGGDDHESREVLEIPAGKDLVVTFATVQAGQFSNIGTAAPPAITTLTSAEGPGIQVFLPMEQQGPEPFWSASLPMDVTFPTQIFFSASTRNRSATGFLVYDYTVAGHLVDEPGP